MQSKQNIIMIVFLYLIRRPRPRRLQSRHLKITIKKYCKEIFINAFNKITLLKDNNGPPTQIKTSISIFIKICVRKKKIF